MTVPCLLASSFSAVCHCHLSPLSMVFIFPSLHLCISTGVNEADTDLISALETTYELVFEDCARCDEFVVNLLDAVPSNKRHSQTLNQPVTSPVDGGDKPANGNVNNSPPAPAMPAATREDLLRQAAALGTPMITPPTWKKKSDVDGECHCVGMWVG